MKRYSVAGDVQNQSYRSVSGHDAFQKVRHYSIFDILNNLVHGDQRRPWPVSQWHWRPWDNERSMWPSGNFEILWGLCNQCGGYEPLWYIWYLRSCEQPMVRLWAIEIYLIFEVLWVTNGEARSQCIICDMNSMWNLVLRSICDQCGYMVNGWPTVRACYGNPVVYMWIQTRRSAWIIWWIVSVYLLEYETRI